MPLSSRLCGRTGRFARCKSAFGKGWTRVDRVALMLASADLSPRNQYIVRIAVKPFSWFTVRLPSHQDRRRRPGGTERQDRSSRLQSCCDLDRTLAFLRRIRCCGGSGTDERGMDRARAADLCAGRVNDIWHRLRNRRPLLAGTDKESGHKFS